MSRRIPRPARTRDLRTTGTADRPRPPDRCPDKARETTTRPTAGGGMVRMRAVGNVATVTMIVRWKRETKHAWERALASAPFGGAGASRKSFLRLRPADPILPAPADPSGPPPALQPTVTLTYDPVLGRTIQAAAFVVSGPTGNVAELCDCPDSVIFMLDVQFAPAAVGRFAPGSGPEKIRSSGKPPRPGKPGKPENGFPWDAKDSASAAAPPVGSPDPAAPAPQWIDHGTDGRTTAIPPRRPKRGRPAPVNPAAGGRDTDAFWQAASDGLQWDGTGI